MLDVSGSVSSLHYSITARPNASLSLAGILCVLLSTSLLTLGIAVGFLLIGAWPILAFAGAELLALFICFCQIVRHARDYEKLTIDDDRVVIEHHSPGHDSRDELNSYWVRVVMECLANGYCQRLALRSHGREIEFGRFLSSEQRLDLGHQLQSRLGGYLS